MRKPNNAPEHGSYSEPSPALSTSDENISTGPDVVAITGADEAKLAALSAALEALNLDELALSDEIEPPVISPEDEAAIEAAAAVQEAVEASAGTSELSLDTPSSEVQVDGRRHAPGLLDLDPDRERQIIDEVLSAVRGSPRQDAVAAALRRYALPSDVFDRLRNTIGQRLRREREAAARPGKPARILHVALTRAAVIDRRDRLKAWFKLSGAAQRALAGKAREIMDDWVTFQRFVAEHGREPGPTEFAAVLSRPGAQLGRFQGRTRRDRLVGMEAPGGPWART